MPARCDTSVALVPTSSISAFRSPWYWHGAGTIRGVGAGAVLVLPAAHSTRPVRGVQCSRAVLAWYRKRSRHRAERNTTLPLGGGSPPLAASSFADSLVPHWCGTKRWLGSTAAAPHAAKQRGAVLV